MNSDGNPSRRAPVSRSWSRVVEESRTTNPMQSTNRTPIIEALARRLGRDHDPERQGEQHRRVRKRDRREEDLEQEDREAEGEDDADAEEIGPERHPRDEEEHEQERAQDAGEEVDRLVDRVRDERDDRSEREHELDPCVEPVHGAVAVGEPLDLEEVLDHGRGERARAAAIPSSASSTV